MKAKAVAGNSRARLSQSTLAKLYPGGELATAIYPQMLAMRIRYGEEAIVKFV